MTMHDNIHNEAGLLTAVAEGSQQAFKELVAACWQNVYVHALTYLRSPEQAEEVTQDIFISIWNKRALLPELDNFRSYLFITARNTIISVLRRKLVTCEELVDEQEETLLPDAKLEAKELNGLLKQGIALLPEKRRRVFEMSRLEGKTHAEIAAALHISKDTVSEYITLALNFLRTYLRKYGNHLHLAVFCLLYL